MLSYDEFYTRIKKISGSSWFPMASKQVLFVEDYIEFTCTHDFIGLLKILIIYSFINEQLFIYEIR